MPSLPKLSGRDVVKLLAKDGWQLARQRGSHMILVKTGHMATLSVPDHREVAKGHVAQPDPIQRLDGGGIHRSLRQVAGDSHIEDFLVTSP
jgi:predicted RNA binding protein YcfA (HicA-like mRNA interferase family)